ncbi:MAG: gas vesicle protein K, partial [Rhabdochlamydiaceae bacterium]
MFLPKITELEHNKKLSNGFAKLVLTIMETLKQLMEKQARHRIKDGSLDDDEIERLGNAFIQLNGKISEIAKLFNLEQKDLSLALLPLETGLRSGGEEVLSLVDLLDRVIEKGVVIFGDLGISVADVELINVQLRLIVSAVKRKGGKKRGSRARRQKPL